VGQAFNLDGVDDHVFIGNPESLKITEAITIDAWINPQDLSEGQITEILSKIGQNVSLDSYALALVNSGGVNQLLIMLVGELYEILSRKDRVKLTCDNFGISEQNKYWNGLNSKTVGPGRWTDIGSK